MYANMAIQSNGYTKKRVFPMPLKVTIYEGKRLNGNLLTQMSNKYCTCRIGNEFMTTTSVTGKEPNWSQTLTFPTTTEEKVFFEVRERNRISDDTVLGIAEMELESVYSRGLIPNQWVMLKTAQGGYAGKIQVRIELEETEPVRQQSVPLPAKKPAVPHSSSVLSSPVNVSTPTFDDTIDMGPSKTTSQSLPAQLDILNPSHSNDSQDRPLPTVPRPISPVYSQTPTHSPMVYQSRPTGSFQHTIPISIKPLQPIQEQDSPIPVPQVHHQAPIAGRPLPSFVQHHTSPSVPGYPHPYPHFHSIQQAPVQSQYQQQLPFQPQQPRPQFTPYQSQQYQPQQYPQQYQTQQYQTQQYQQPQFRPLPYQSYPQQSSYPQQPSYPQPIQFSTLPYRQPSQYHNQHGTLSHGVRPYISGLEEKYHNLSIDQLATLPYPPPSRP